MFKYSDFQAFKYSNFLMFTFSNICMYLYNVLNVRYEDNERVYVHTCWFGLIFQVINNLIARWNCLNAGNPSYSAVCILLRKIEYTQRGM